MTDLTRFDFHVVRFMESETVERMSDAEIGQYVLLLCKAWLQGKDATLPDDLQYLSKHARCDKLSKKVLAKFPLIDTEWGKRRRNPVLYGEWLMAVDRSASAAERGRKGNGVRWGERNSDQLAIAEGIAQTNSIIPNQTNQNTNIEFKGGTFGQGNYSNIRAHWYRYFKKNLSTSKRNKEQYAQACATYDEDRVLEYLKTWAAENDWVSAHQKGDNRLYVFLAALPSMVAGDQMRQSSEVERVAATQSQKKLWAATIAADDERIRKKKEEDAIAREEEQRLIELTRGAIC